MMMNSQLGDGEGKNFPTGGQAPRWRRCWIDSESEDGDCAEAIYEVNHAEKSEQNEVDGMKKGLRKLIPHDKLGGNRQNSRNVPLLESAEPKSSRLIVNLSVLSNLLPYLHLVVTLFCKYNAALPGQM